MKIRKATQKDLKDALNIAKELKEWFNKEGIKNMAIDFKHNNIILALDDKKVLGFICYTTYCGKILLIWMGIRRNLHRKRIGEQLLRWLEKEAKRLNLHSIEVETLPDEDDYKPYKNTRKFYYKHGFKRVEYRKARVKGWDDQILLEKKIK